MNLYCVASSGLQDSFVAHYTWVMYVTHLIHSVDIYIRDLLMFHHMDNEVHSTPWYNYLTYFVLLHHRPQALFSRLLNQVLGICIAPNMLSVLATTKWFLIKWAFDYTFFYSSWFFIFLLLASLYRFQRLSSLLAVAVRRLLSTVFLKMHQYCILKSNFIIHYYNFLLYPWF